MVIKGFFQYEIIINVLASPFRFIWIHMLWVYGHYKYFNFFSAGIDFRRRNLTSKVFPAARVNAIFNEEIMYYKTLSVMTEKASWFCVEGALVQCWYNVGPPSGTMAQYKTNIVLMLCFNFRLQNTEIAYKKPHAVSVIATDLFFSFSTITLISKQFYLLLRSWKTGVGAYFIWIQSIFWNFRKKMLSSVIAAKIWPIQKMFKCEKCAPHCFTPFISYRSYCILIWSTTRVMLL